MDERQPFLSDYQWHSSCLFRSQFSEVVRKHTGEPPVFLVYFLYDNMRMFRFFSKYLDQCLRELIYNLGFLIAGGTFGNLQVDIRLEHSSPFSLA